MLIPFLYFSCLILVYRVVADTDTAKIYIKHNLPTVPVAISLLPIQYTYLKGSEKKVRLIEIRIIC